VAVRRVTVPLRASSSTVLACVLGAWCGCALALDPTLDVAQYAHTAWKIREGFSKGGIGSFAQTSDGYLWLGTEFGLLRFDGVRNVEWQPPGGSSLPDNHVRALLATRDGALWIGTYAGLAKLQGGRLTTYGELDGESINGLVEDGEGTVWVSTNARGRGLLCAIRDANVRCDGGDGKLGAYAGSLYEDSRGNLWVAAASGLWRWKPGPPSAYPLPNPLGGSLQVLAEGASGALVVVTRPGIAQVSTERVEALPIPSLPPNLRATDVLRDREGSLWIGTLDAGIVHVREGRTDFFARSDGLSGDRVGHLFEDREGNVWVATTEGVDRFRALAAATSSVGRGLASGIGAVLADRDGSVWISAEASLNRFRNGHWTVYSSRHEPSSDPRSPRPAQTAGDESIMLKGFPDSAAGSLLQDSRGRLWLGTYYGGLGYLEGERFVPVAGVPAGFIDSIVEDSEGSIWIAHRDAGLMRISPGGDVRSMPWTSLGSSGPARRLAPDPSRRGLWLGFDSGGVAQFVDGRVSAAYATGDGPVKGRVNALYGDGDGTLWVGTPSSLGRVRDGRLATLDSADGLPCNGVLGIVADDDGSLWLYMTCGLVRIARSELVAWASAIEHGSGARRTIRATVLGSADGVRSVESVGSPSPQIARSTDGTLWLAARDGVTMVDPRHLPYNKLPPPVHVEQVVADRRPYDPSAPLSLPPLVRDLQIEYTALSFVAPEKVLFRYKLEGRDRDWQDAGNRRQAFYTDLAPGNYRFRVIACNNSGVWNENGASLDFSIAPAYWQTSWFRALCVLAFIALLLALYLLRVRHLARQFNTTLDARVNERMRIARDLHDTLLQSFHGLLLRFQTATDLLPNRATEAKQVLDSAIDQAAEAITEGRDAVQGLRTSAMETNDLADAIRTVGEELAADEGASRGVVLRVEAQGAPRTLHPIVRDEILRIAGEAMRNAFRHAEAKHIEVELRYDERELRLRVRDDGKGIDPKVLNRGGREGHFGMHGMRERAKLIGGKLTVWSGLDSGTELELSIPAAHAYTSSSSSTWRSRLAEKLKRQGTTSDS
jgi:ligand-binding sensor domain-containing protein/signal transduction histidine kinase